MWIFWKGTYRFAVLPAHKMLEMFFYIWLAMILTILLLLEQYCYVKVSWYDVDIKDTSNGICQFSIFSFPYRPDHPMSRTTQEIQVKKYGSIFTMYILGFPQLF